MQETKLMKFREIFWDTTSYEATLSLKVKTECICLLITTQKTLIAHSVKYRGIYSLNIIDTRDILRILLRKTKNASLPPMRRLKRQSSSPTRDVSHPVNIQQQCLPCFYEQFLFFALARKHANRMKYLGTGKPRATVKCPAPTPLLSLCN